MAPLLRLDTPTIASWDYQEEAIARVQEVWTLPARRSLVVLPTGRGKSLMFAALLKRLNEAALILAHCEELLTLARHVSARLGAGHAVVVGHQGQRLWRLP